MESRKSRGHVLLTLLFLGLAGVVQGKATVLFEGATVEVATTLPDATDLWIPPGELTRVNGFELKPEGACLDDICVPVRQDVDSSIYVRRGGAPWFNVSELARRLEQPVVADYDASVWSLGAVPATRMSLINQRRAPDFTLTDKEANPVSLSDFKGKKIMLLTWASW